MSYIFVIPNIVNMFYIINSDFEKPIFTLQHPTITPLIWWEYRLNALFINKALRKERFVNWSWPILSYWCTRTPNNAETSAETMSK